MSDMPAADKAKANMRQQNGANLQSKGPNPSGCSTAKKPDALQAKAEYARSHPNPYRK
jgi:hypothetical protein